MRPHPWFGIIVPLIGLIAVAAGSHAASGHRDPGNASAPVVQISSTVPMDVDFDINQPDQSAVQRASNRFAWLQFVAINWPSKPGVRGEPDPAASINAPGVRVWETWKDTREVFLPKGAQPADWDSWPENPVKETASRQVVHRLSSTLQASASDSTLPPILTDRHGRVVRYEVRMNRVLFDYIRANHLYNGLEQARNESISFPNGSMLIKAAWRELNPGEESRFLCADAWLSDQKNGKSTHMRKRKMGLIGYHIVQKTPQAPQWIWSTFEQVDNLAGANSSLLCGAPTSRAANLQTRPGVPTRVSRLPTAAAMQEDVIPQDVARANVQSINLAFQKELAQNSSPLQYYELIDTQWPTRPGGEAPTGTRVSPVPAVLANSTMETFTQDTSSCMGCHAMARTSRTDRFQSADFTFTLKNALPAVPDSRILDAPARPISAWDRRNWAAIQLGRELTEKTYERLPQYAHSKLHCGSCHLDSASNPDSAWWVGMSVKYPTLEKLQARVNQCFERSMNGVPIPAVQEASDLETQAPLMNAFLTYMKWLDEQYALKNASPPHMGLTLLRPLAGDGVRGKQIFLQKCAVCHQKDGGGRYEHGVYFRPALWGPNAFNTLAGMDKPDKLAAFVKANMPYGSGGELTDQEAWDLSAFLHSQSRPIKK